MRLNQLTHTKMGGGQFHCDLYNKYTTISDGGLSQTGRGELKWPSFLNYSVLAFHLEKDKWWLCTGYQRIQTMSEENLSTEFVNSDWTKLCTFTGSILQ